MVTLNVPGSKKPPSIDREALLRYLIRQTLGFLVVLRCLFYKPRGSSSGLTYLYIPYLLDNCIRRLSCVIHDTSAIFDKARNVFDIGIQISFDHPGCQEVV